MYNIKLEDAKMTLKAVLKTQLGQWTKRSVLLPSTLKQSSLNAYDGALTEMVMLGVIDRTELDGKTCYRLKS